MEETMDKYGYEWKRDKETGNWYTIINFKIVYLSAFEEEMDDN